MPLDRDNITGIIVGDLVNCPTGRCAAGSTFLVGFFQDDDSLVTHCKSCSEHQGKDDQVLEHDCLLFYIIAVAFKVSILISDAQCLQQDILAGIQAPQCQIGQFSNCMPHRLAARFPDLQQ